ncbi:MAG: hypothetical protein AB7F96_03685 [Beijerinckiaceae bacterium]
MLVRAIQLCMFAIIFAAIPSRGQAQNTSCAAWTLKLEQDEGGKIWNASICSSGPKGDSWLSLSCSRKQFNLRYLPMIDGEFENRKLDFVFSAEGSSQRLRLAYEAMDGAFAGNISRNNALVGILRKGARLTVTETGSNMRPMTFTLKGAGRALKGLAGKCRN